MDFFGHRQNRICEETCISYELVSHCSRASVGVFRLFSFSDSVGWPQNCLQGARGFAAHCGSFLLCGPWGAQPTMLCPHLSYVFCPLYFPLCLLPLGGHCPPKWVGSTFAEQQLLQSSSFCRAAAFAEQQQSLGKKCWQRERLCIIKQHALLHETAVLLNTLRYFIIRALCHKNYTIMYYWFG